MARESCRQGPSFASRSPKSRMARRCCQRRPAFPRQRHAAWPNGLCAMRQRHATRSMAERALRPAARAWPACRMRPPVISPAFIAAVLHASRFAARIAPTHAAIRRAAHCGQDELSIGLFLPPSCCPRRRIVPIDARSPAPPGPRPAPTEPQPRANRTPAPRQPDPSPAPAESRPARGAICAHPRPATRRASPCRAGSAAVLVIPAKWCGDTIAHTRKLRF